MSSNTLEPTPMIVLDPPFLTAFGSLLLGVAALVWAGGASRDP